MNIILRIINLSVLALSITPLTLIGSKPREATPRPCIPTLRCTRLQEHRRPVAATHNHHPYATQAAAQETTFEYPRVLTRGRSASDPTANRQLEQIPSADTTQIQHDLTEVQQGVMHAFRNNSIVDKLNEINLGLAAIALYANETYSLCKENQHFAHNFFRWAFSTLGLITQALKKISDNVIRHAPINDEPGKKLLLILENFNRAINILKKKSSKLNINALPTIELLEKNLHTHIDILIHKLNQLNHTPKKTVRFE